MLSLSLSLFSGSHLLSPSAFLFLTFEFLLISFSALPFHKTKKTLLEEIKSLMATTLIFWPSWSGGNKQLLLAGGSVGGGWFLGGGVMMSSRHS
ncbi:hypothetical protein BKA57DRAFT_205274 [Linnemannia elongata]|nr:hypothetical protein BKA57DRAFT_205274 [Linnemannia elongata]